MQNAVLRTRAPARNESERHEHELPSIRSPRRSPSPHQLEVLRLDRRRRNQVRALSFFGAAIVIVLALWSAGVPPVEWLRGWMEGDAKKREEIASSVPAQPVTPGVTQTVSPHSLPGTDVSISPVPLPLILVATSPGRSPSEGTANIGTNPTNPQTYAAGALLLNGARLTEIHQTYVMLQRGNKTARLDLVGPEGAPTSVSNDLLSVGGVELTAATKVEPSYEIVTDYIRPSPVFDGDLLRGYEVYAGQASSVFSQMGLQGGDVIIALNDVPLTDPEQAMDMFRQIASGMAATATLERKGKRERISLDGALIAAHQERKREQQSLAQATAPLPPG